MKEGSEPAKNEESELLQVLREQAKKSALLEQENQRLKKSLDQKEERNQQLENKNKDFTRKLLIIM